MEDFIVYTYDHKGFVVTIGKECKYVELTEKSNTFYGKTVNIIKPIRRIAVSMEDIKNHYKTIEKCTDRCKFIKGKIEHKHEEDRLLIIKMKQ